MLFAKLFARRDSRSSSLSLGHTRRPAAARRRTHRPPHVDLLEDRTLLSGWVIDAVGTVDDPVGVGLTTDSTGNVYVTGNFLGTADFDPGPGTSTLTSAGGTSDIFVAKYSPAGALVWARRAGGADPSGDSGKAVAVDASGSVTVAGQFFGTADFGSFSLTSGGSSDVFVTKLDGSGNFLWARSAGATGFDVGLGAAVDSSGNVHVTGGFEATVDFDPGPDSQLLSSTGVSDRNAFVWKLDTNGNFVWAQSAGEAGAPGCAGAGGGFEQGNGIGVDASGSVYTTGSFTGTVDFDPGPATVNLTSAGCRDVFVWKLDANGSLAWATRAGGLGHDGVSTNGGGGIGIAVDAGGNVYTTGSFTGPADFGSTTLTSMLNNSGTPSQDTFVAKQDASGSFLWARAVGDGRDDGGTGVALDSSGNVYVSGTLGNGFGTGTADFDPGAGTAYLTSIGGTDAFSLKLDTGGSFAWARRAVGTGWDRGLAIALDPSGNVFTTGSFIGTTDFDTGSAIVALTSVGDTPNVFLLKTSQDVPTSPQLARLVDSPDPVAKNGTLTLTASGIRVVAGGSNVVSVSFYRDKNGNGTLEVGTDTFLGTDTDGSNGWSRAVTAPNKNGITTYFAQAKDASNVAGNVVSARNRVGPGGPVASMVTSRDVRQGSVDAAIASHYFNNDDRENNLTLPERLDRHTLRDLLRARRGGDRPTSHRAE